MSDLTSLPSDTTPEDFFYEALPEVLGDVDLPDGLGPDRMQFNVIGPNGVKVSIGIDDDGELCIEEGQWTSPPMAVTISEEDFLSLLVGDLRDAIKDAKPDAVVGARQLRHAFIPDRVVQKIRALSGDLQVRIQNRDSGDETVVTITLGGKAPDTENPSCTVSVDVSTLLDIASGKENPQQLFMQGRIRIDGDMGLVLTLMTIMQAG